MISEHCLDACIQDFPWEDKEARAKMVYEGDFVITEAEVAFDAADAIRFGKDIVITLSHVSRLLPTWNHKWLVPYICKW